MEKALTLAQMILKKEPESLETLIITANILQKQGKIREAIEIVTAVDKFKEAEYIKHYLGILYLQDSNLTEAFNHFKAALAIQPDYLPSLIEVATIISEISPKQSISILKKVLEIEPYNRKALARLGKIYESIENDF
jgi:tetratricopeptide (TPR) repeat protein